MPLPDVPLETPASLFGRLRLGREEFCQRLLTSLILEGPYPKWNTRSRTSARGTAFLRDVYALSFDTAWPGDDFWFVDEFELPARVEEEKGGYPDYALLWDDRVWWSAGQSGLNRTPVTPIPYGGRVSPSKAIRLRVQRLLSDYLGAEAGDPADEPAVIRSGSAMVYVRLIAADPALVRVFSPMVTGVPASSELFEELNSINASACFARVFWRDDRVYAAAEHLAADLDDPELANLCDWVADLADHHDDRLQERFGGELASGD